LIVVSARTTTTTALLEGLGDPRNEAVWREFDDRYRPIIVGFLKKLGFGNDDAADLTQDTLIRVVQDYRAGKYDRQRGRLRSWIIGIVKYRVADLRRARAKRREWRGDSVIAELPDDNRLTAVWEVERKRAILRQAIAELRDQSKLNEKAIHAFERYVVQERPAAEVARDLGLTPHDVYMAKRNVAKRLRTILARMEALFDDG